MKMLELKGPETGVLSASERSDNAHGGGDRGPQLYVSWGDHPQAFLEILLTEPCIPCCTTL